MPLGIDRPRLPEGWIWCQVQDVGEAILGKSKSGRARPTDDQFPYLRVANVQEDGLDLGELATMHFSDAERERYKLRQFDILLCEGQSPELVGRPAMYRDEMADLYFQNHLIRFRCGPFLEPEFALMAFRAYMHDGTFEAVATSTTNLASLGLRRFRQLPFPLAPVDVQQRIAELARSAQNEIDYLRQRLAVIYDYLQNLWSGIRDSQILRGGNHELSNGEYPEIFGGGSWSAAASIVTAPIVYGIVQPGAPQPPGEGVPYVRGQDIRDGEILVDELPRASQDIAAKYGRSTLQANDVVMSIIRHMRAAIVSEELAGANLSRGAARFRPVERMDSTYLMHWLESSAAQTWLKRHLRGTGMPGLNLSDVRDLPIPVPPLEVQREIGERLNSHTDAARDLSERLKRAELLADRAERGILTELLGGELAFSITEQALRGQRHVEVGEQLFARLRESIAVNRKTTSGPRAETRRGAKVSNTARRGHRGMKPSDRHRIVDIVRGARTDLTPLEVFERTGIGVDSIDEFFDELRTAVEQRLVTVARPDGTAVFIRAM